MNSTRAARTSTLTFSSEDSSSSGSDHDYYKNKSDTNVAASPKTDEIYIKAVLLSNRRVDTKLKLLCASMNLLAERGDVPKARRIVDLTYAAKITPNVHMYTILIKAFNRAGLPNQVFDVLNEMRVNNVRPNTVTCNQILSVQSRVKPELVAEILRFMQQECIEADVHTFNCTLDHLCKINRMDLALNLFYCLKNKGDPLDTASYNIIINAYGKMGRLDEAERFLQKMQHRGLHPDVFSFTILIDAYGKTQNGAKAFAHFNAMTERQFVPSVVTCNNLLGTLHRDNDHVKIMAVLEQMKKAAIVPDEKTYSTIGEYICSLQTEEAKAVLRLLERSELYSEDKTYARLINTYVHIKKIDQAKLWYSRHFPLATCNNEVDLHNCLSFGAAFIKVLLLLENPDKAPRISVINTKNSYSNNNEKMAEFVWDQLKKYYIAHGNAIRLECTDDDPTTFTITFPWVLNPYAPEFVPAGHEAKEDQ